MIISFVATPLLACAMFHYGWILYENNKSRQLGSHWSRAGVAPKMRLGMIMMILGVAIFVMNAIKIIVIN